MWITDPRTKEKSVSLTLVVASFVIAVVAIGLEIGRVSSTLSGSMELLYACSALYFGRRWTGKGGVSIDGETKH